MATLFYALMVWWRDDLHWNWNWFFVSLVFSALGGGSDIQRIYRYTTRKELDGVEIRPGELAVDRIASLDRGTKNERR